MNSDTSLSTDLVKVMRQIPFPVTIVTAASKGEMRGITIGSFTSLSLKPPLVSFNVEKRASMYDLISNVDKFAIHIPGADQAHLCNRFATPDLTGDEQFKDIDYKPDPEGVPLLRNVPAIIQCRKFKLIETGDHSIIVGEVIKVIRNKNEPAILYLSGSYRSLDFK